MHFNHSLSLESFLFQHIYIHVLTVPTIRGVAQVFVHTQVIKITNRKNQKLLLFWVNIKRISSSFMEISRLTEYKNVGIFNEHVIITTKPQSIPFVRYFLFIVCRSIAV